MFDRQQSIRRSAVVTTSDTVDIPVTRSLYFNSGGTVRLTFADSPSATVDYVIPPGGIARPLSVTRVWSTGTTVTPGNIIAEY